MISIVIDLRSELINNKIFNFILALVRPYPVSRSGELPWG